jgi:hypothetical protein
MKDVTLCCLLLFISIANIAQSKNKGGYFSLRGGVAFDQGATKGIGHLSIGVSPNHIFGVGAGVGIAKFDKLYIPLTADISFFGKPGNISLVVIGSAGYGVYKYVTPFFTVKGGFTGSFNAGVAFPVKGYTKLFLTAGYAIYSFSGGQNIQTSGVSYKSESSAKMFTITAGFKI